MSIECRGANAQLKESVQISRRVAPQSLSDVLTGTGELKIGCPFLEQGYCAARDEGYKVSVQRELIRKGKAQEQNIKPCIHGEGERVYKTD